MTDTNTWDRLPPDVSGFAPGDGEPLVVLVYWLLGGLCGLAFGIVIGLAAAKWGGIGS